MPTLISTTPAAVSRIRRKCPSDQHATRRAAVDENRPGLIGIDRAYSKTRKAPHSYGRVFRDAVDALIPRRKLLLVGFRGTDYYSKREIFNRNEQSAHLKELGVQVDEHGTPTPVEAARAKALYPSVAHLVTEQGDLHAPALELREVKQFKHAGPIYVKRGCFGVPFWRAMQPRCLAAPMCPMTRECDAVIDYRLTFGGRGEYDRSFSPAWSPEKKQKAQNWFDQNADWRYNQHFQRLRYDPNIRKLLSVYTGIWYLSDLTADRRLQDFKWEEHASIREADATRIATESALKEAEAYSRTVAFEDEIGHAVQAAMESKTVERITKEIADFFGRTEERRWRKARKNVEQLAAVEVARICVEDVVEKHPELSSLATKKSVAVLAARIHDASRSAGATSSSGTKAIDYNVANRHLSTLDAIRVAGGIR